MIILTMLLMVILMTVTVMLMALIMISETDDGNEANQEFWHVLNACMWLFWV